MNLLTSKVTAFSITLIAVAAIFASAAPVLADTSQETAIGDVTDPGLLPDSGFYFIKTWVRNLQLMFANGNAQKAELHMRYANEDVLGIKKLCDQGKCDTVHRYTEQYQLQLQTAIQNTEQARIKEGNQIADNLASRLQQNYLRQQEVLASVLSQAPVQAQNGILDAIENSSRQVENMIREQQGEAALEQYREQITQQTNNMGENTRLMIQQRLEASHGQVGNPSVGDSQTSDNFTGGTMPTADPLMQGQGAGQQGGQQNIQGQDAPSSSGQGTGSQGLNNPGADEHGNKN